jgi:formate-dependent nitrite reductase membrane component NrfD
MFFIGIVVMLVGIFVLYSKREEEEEWLVFKLLGYYVLGIFNVSFNGIVFPVGFVISLFLRPRQNKGSKRGASILGLVMMIIGLLFGLR